MAVFIGGTSGLVTSWGSNTQLIETGHRPAQFTLDVSADSPNVTGFVSGGTSSTLAIPGMRTVSGTIRGLSIANSGPLVGVLGSVTYSSGYVSNLRSWEIAIACDPQNATALGVSATQNGWHQFVPGLVSWSGSYSAMQDDTTPLVAPAKSSDPAAATFVVYTNKYFGGNIVSTRLGADTAVDAVGTAEYSFVGSGTCTVTDASGTLPFAAGAIPRPTTGTLLLQSVTNQTFSVSAFWTAVRMSVTPDAAVSVEVDFQGTGELTFG